jgi:hypothetical protein
LLVALSFSRQYYGIMPITANDAALISHLQAVVRKSEQKLEESRKGLEASLKVLNESYAIIARAKTGGWAP